MDQDIEKLLDTHSETNEMSMMMTQDNVIPLSEVKVIRPPLHHRVRLSLTVIKGFSDNVQWMSKKAIIVENLAWLYANVIQGVMMGGLEDLTRNYSNAAEQHQHLDRAISDQGQFNQLQITSSDNSSSTTLAISTSVSQPSLTRHHD